jgi:hypothetical protein
MTSAPNISEEKRGRGFRPTPYMDPEGNLVIGFATRVRKGDICITESEAESRLKEELRGE